MKGLLRASVNVLPLNIRRAIKHLPFVASLQRWLIRSFMSGEPFVHRINAGPASGLSFEVTLPIDKAVWSGTYETEFSGALRDVINPGDVCYDIGGYRGYTGGVMAMAGAKFVYIFEPLPQNIAALKRLQELNPTLPLTVVETAIGDRNGTAQFKAMPDPSMGKISESKFQPSAPESSVIEVAVARLDSLVKDRGYPPPDVVKIDVEGAEIHVLRGALGLLRNFRPTLLIEAHSDELGRECAKFAADLGYSIAQIEVDSLGETMVRHLICRAGDPL